jgi:prepilin-type N-terminal cleavage/methylation domain-containing protein
MKSIRRHSAFVEIRNPKSQIRNPRAAFTLVELMVVVVIISILLAILLPAISKIRTNVNEARVISEINQLSTAITAFKSKYGIEPPSQISIYLTQAGWTGDPASMATIRTIWPQFDFGMTGGAGVAYPAYWANTVNLNSGECLLFFLGGVMNAAGTGQVPTGFAKNPRYPFAPVSANANREGPFFEFTATDRIRDIDGNGMNEWYDSLPGQTNPYLYFSSYDGQGYRLAELPQSGGNYLFIHDFYRVSPTVANPPATPPASPTGSQTLPAQKPQSFQIISPGYDADYGAGGVFNTNLPNAGLTDSSGNPDKAAYDNLTNINGGRLNP